jgi:hypothetical protein
LDELDVWALQLLEAFRRRIAVRRASPELRVEVCGVTLEEGGDAMRIVYQREDMPARVFGFRRTLPEYLERAWPDDPPSLTAQYVADEMAFEIEEPLGAYESDLEPDEVGIEWWGDGYRRD